VVARLESGLRQVEEAVRAGDQAEWKRTSPEALARAEATVSQLEASVAQLEQQVVKATERGDAKAAASAQESLDARHSWLAEAERTLADFRR
jgi:porphobilinogen deaminase